MAARAKETHVDKKDRRLPAGRDEAMLATFELRDSRCEFKGGRSTVRAVAVRCLRPIPVIGDVPRRAENGSGAAEDWSRKRAKSRRRGCRGVYQLRAPVERHASLRRVANGLDIVSIGIQNERTIVVLVIVRPRTRT